MSGSDGIPIPASEYPRLLAIALDRAEKAEAALAALWEVVESNVPVLNNWKMEDDEKDAAASSIFDALAATPADLAARVRARHRAEALREAADTIDRPGFEVGAPPASAVARWLRALAADAEKGGTR